MRVDTTRFGTLEVAEEARVYFPEGLLGFGSFREYLLLSAGSAGASPAGASPAASSGARVRAIQWLQSCQAPELAFALCPAEVLLSDYRVSAAPEDLARIELTTIDEAAVYFIIHRDREGLVANLRGPLLINEARRLGAQYVVNDSRVSLRYRIPLRKPLAQAVATQAARRAV